MINEPCLVKLAPDQGTLTCGLDAIHQLLAVSGKGYLASFITAVFLTGKKLQKRGCYLKAMGVDTFCKVIDITPLTWTMTTAEELNISVNLGIFINNCDLVQIPGRS